jgi:hypothetical protein
MKSYLLDIELFQGYMCPGIPVTEDLSFEVEFSDEEVAKIRQLVKDYDGDKEAGLMPILLNDAPELHERISKAAFQEIYDYYLLEGLRGDGFILDEEEQKRNFKNDLESGEFDPEEYIEDSACYDEVPTDEDELFNLWEEWERDQFCSCDIDWALERYPDLPEQMDLEDDHDYICFIPDAFKCF